MRNRAFTLMVVALLAVSLVWAGGEKGHKDPAAKAAKLQAKLNLTDAQTEQLRVLMVDTEARWAEIKASGYDEAARAEAKKKLKEEYYSSLKTILTDEQFARYQEMKAESSGKKRK